MISTKKKITYGLALIISSALFANEIVKATRSEEAPTPIERPAEIESTPVLRPTATANSVDVVVESTPIEAPTAGSTGASTGGGLDAALQSLESALARMDASERSDGGRRVDALARSKRLQDQRKAIEESERAPASSHTQQVEPPVDASESEEPVVTRRSDAEKRAQLQRYLEQSPLIGIVRGERESSAMFGGQIVRVGDALLGDDARITGFDAEGVIVSLGGRETHIALPPVRTRPSAAQSGGAPTAEQASAPASPNAGATTNQTSAGGAS